MRFPRKVRWAVVGVTGMLLLSGLARAQDLAAVPSATVEPDPAIAANTVDPKLEPHLSHSQLVSLLRKRIKYIFVLYQENRSFDSFFGTFPGADGLFSQPADQTPGFTQPILNVDGTQSTVSPFRIGPDQNAADVDDVDHSHPGLIAKMDVVGDTAKMDRFAMNEEGKASKRAGLSLAAKQLGELTMAYEDGDTIPILWRWANRFVLCDHIFQLMIGPSTPGNLSIIGAQSGMTQWMLHPDQVNKPDLSSGGGVPVLSDPDPYWGSPADSSSKMPYNPKDYKKDAAAPDKVAENMTYATIVLTLTGKSLPRVTSSDLAPQTDLADIGDDITDIGKSGKDAVDWGWFQEGFDNEATSADSASSEATHEGYVTHHNGPQYFGYIANNPQMSSHLHGLHDFLNAVASNQLSPGGGLYYVKGGTVNSLGLTSSDPDPAVQRKFRGDDDHPGDSDSQISEIMLAKVVNAIAASPYWNNCAIVITWDDCDGQYDHVPPPILLRAPDGSPLSDGPRVPLLVISPYARAHAIDQDSGDHASVVKLADTIFNLKPLADLPDEARGRAIGEKTYHLKNMGPFDDIVSDVCDLTSAFDPARLAGKAPVLTADYAAVPDLLVTKMPSEANYGWHEVGVLPEDYRLGILNHIPGDFNPRPASSRPKAAVAGGD